jgi:hypothetical protein
MMLKGNRGRSPPAAAGCLRAPASRQGLAGRPGRPAPRRRRVARGKQRAACASTNRRCGAASRRIAAKVSGVTEVASGATTTPARSAPRNTAASVGDGPGEHDRVAGHQAVALQGRGDAVHQRVEFAQLRRAAPMHQRRPIGPGAGMFAQQVGERPKGRRRGRGGGQQACALLGSFDRARVFMTRAQTTTRESGPLLQIISGGEGGIRTLGTV